MPSSTSSSDVHLREIPDQPWLRLTVISFILFTIVIGIWEVFARSMQHIPGTYDGYSETWAVERGKLDQANNIRVILTGSSRILWASDLDILEQGFGARPLQLALPGTGPAMVVKDIVDNTEFDGLIVVGVTPFLFNRLDEGFFGKVAFERHRFESPSQRSGRNIHNFLSDYFGFIDESFHLFQLINRYTNLPQRKGAKNLMEEEWKLGNIYADRQTDMWPPVEIVGSFDNVQITNFWSPGLRRPTETPERMVEMVSPTIEYFSPLIDKLRTRGGDIVFIRMPSGGKYLEHDIKTNYRGLTWDPMIEGFDAPALNSFDYPALSAELKIPEWSHLNRDSQDKWSRDVIPIIKQTYLATRGFSVDEIINADQSRIKSEAQ